MADARPRMKFLGRLRVRLERAAVHLSEQFDEITVRLIAPHALLFERRWS